MKNLLDLWRGFRLRVAVPEQPYSRDLPYDPELNLEIARLNKVRLRGSRLAMPTLALIVLFSGNPRGSAAFLLTCGTIVVVTGLLLRLWAICSIDGYKKSVLVTWGPYHYLRHPLYLGSLLYLAGFCILAGSITAAIVACVVFVGLYVPVVRVEERFLADRFGELWDAHREKTWALFPKLRPRPSAAGPPFQLRRPFQEIAFLLLLLVVAYGGSGLMRSLHHKYSLPDVFF